MTRKMDVEHVGGPFDGHTVPVDVDEDGVPQSVYMAQDLGPTDISANPMHGPAAGIATFFYHLDMVPTDDGVKYIYRYDAETLSDAA